MSNEVHHSMLIITMFTIPSFMQSKDVKAEKPAKITIIAQPESQSIGFKSPDGKNLNPYVHIDGVRKPELSDAWRSEEVKRWLEYSNKHVQDPSVMVKITGAWTRVGFGADFVVDSFELATKEEIEKAEEKTKQQEKEKMKTPDEVNEDEWNQLFARYTATCESTSGCGSRGQVYINAALKKLSEFAATHEGFATRLPRRVVCRDDGTFGVSSGIALMAADSARRGEECTVM
jgi:hypothetical protein